MCAALLLLTPTIHLCCLCIKAHLQRVKPFLQIYGRMLEPSLTPDQQLYQRFGLARGSAAQMFGARVWACGVRAALKGHFIGKPVGDPWLMPGVFVVHGEQVLWQHDFVHAGDHPNIPKLVNVVKDLVVKDLRDIAGANP